MGGGAQESIVVSEPGVYRLVFRSRKPEAERFKRWLAHEVIPAIRRTGSYTAPGALDPLAVEIDIQHAPLAAKVGLLNLVMKARGREAMVAYMVYLGLPPLPEAPRLSLANAGHGALSAFLDHLLSGRPVADWIEDAAGGGEAAIAALAALGVKLGIGGVWIANASPAIAAIFAPTPWRNGGWIVALRQLPGAAAGERHTFAGQQYRTTWVPLTF